MRPHPLITRLRRELEARADPAQAAPMKAYMKSKLPFYGIKTPERRRICRAVFDAHPLEAFTEWRQVTLALWREARYREERYAAIELTGHRFYRTFQTMRALPLYEEMITTGAWWDYVDVIAGHRLQALLVRYPRIMTPRMRSWSTDPDRWKRRSTILCQLRRKQSTDLDLLYHCIEANLEDRDFFIRKAIGWALRDYAWSDPREVRRYVAAHADTLSPLSRREALKNLPRVANG